MQSQDDVDESREDYDNAPPPTASSTSSSPTPEFVRLADFFARCEEYSLILSINLTDLRSEGGLPALANGPTVR